MKKTIAKKTASVSHQILAQGQSTGVTDPVPTTLAPSPPEGFIAAKIGRGNSILRSQVAIAPKAAAEVQKSTTYLQQFGSAAPDKASVADALTTASAWSGVVQNAAAWYSYVRQQESAAWKHATSLTDPLRIPFEFRQARDASVAKEFPSLASFYAGPKVRAQKAVATKKKNAAAATAQSKMATAPAVEAPPQAAPAATLATKELN